jgi:mttA/Hcf106 family
LGIFEIILFLIIALIVIPPDDLPQVMRAVGKVMRELRLASNTVMREISGAIGDDAPFNILPPRFDDPPPPTPPAAPMPPQPAFLAPEPQPQPPPGGERSAEAAPPAPPAPTAPTEDARANPEIPAEHLTEPPTGSGAESSAPAAPAESPATVETAEAATADMSQKSS